MFSPLRPLTQQVTAKKPLCVWYCARPKMQCDKVTLPACIARLEFRGGERETHTIYNISIIAAYIGGFELYVKHTNMKYHTEVSRIQQKIHQMEAA